MRLDRFRVLTFDCYGTLIDWETGIWEALAPWLRGAGAAVGREELLACFGRHESPQQKETPGLRYPELLGAVLRRMGGELGIPVTDDDAAAFGASVGDWPAFSDTPGALAWLKRHFRLVILSNIDRESFAKSNARLGVAFDAIYTAEEIGSYKPDPRNFTWMLERLAAEGFGKGDILHVAESLYHDHIPAKAAGLATAWIHRRAGKEGFGATHLPGVEAAPDFRFESMAALAEAHRSEVSG